MSMENNIQVIDVAEYVNVSRRALEKRFKKYLGHTIANEIESAFGKEYLQTRRFKSKKDAQEAHEAIRPTYIEKQVVSNDRDQQRLYELIWRQFVACQMPPAEYTVTTVTVTASDYELSAKGRIIRFDGFTRVQPPAGRKGEDTVLPDVKPGSALSLKDLEPAQHFTKPAPRYGEASLVRELEKRGIGRPSTYASIISTAEELHRTAGLRLHRVHGGAPGRGRRGLARLARAAG